MRIGSDHQSEIQSFLKDSATDPRLNAQLEELVWKAGSITDEEIDMFCLLVRAVGTLGRAYDPSSTTRQPILLGAAAAARRDITKQHAHDLLH
ncbi:Metastasis-associated protein MTA3 [Fasciola hepatica]|uniref:Metastasis-associated protein MTA3 n=1 Tax=Fasciola hepatica TaxID=6192 RepID=A0A2H1CSE5_FASHE|nr:Metastasis-associated protein MTA3 [Fasciola hepatica]